MELASTLNECVESGQTFVVELPNQHLVAIQSLDPSEEDSLIDELLVSNPQFQALVERSRDSPRKAFQPVRNGD
jgi:hypothetical protein